MNELNASQKAFIKWVINYLKTNYNSNDCIWFHEASFVYGVAVERWISRFSELLDGSGRCTDTMQGMLNLILKDKKLLYRPTRGRPGKYDIITIEHNFKVE